MSTYDGGLARVHELAKEFASGAHAVINEDTTRLRFIDVLLCECLDWHKFSQVKTEERTDHGTIDYHLAPDRGIPMLIVEAKKTGISFELPTEAKGTLRLVRTLKAVSSMGKGISGALEQAAGYALAEGAPFAAVTNGWQVIAFCTQVAPGVSWRKGKALVFHSLEAIRDNFLEFWNALSVASTRQFALQRRLLEELPGTVAPRRSATISNYGRNKNRNEFQADLQILGDLVFGGRLFEDRQLFHEHCYCAGGAIPQFSRASRSYLEDRYPSFFSSTAQTPALEPAQTKKGPAAALTNLTNIRKPILLLGDVGVGKTTFLEHLFLVEWADKKDQLIVLRIDLADKPSRPEDLPDLVAQEIEQSLREHYGIDIEEDAFLRGVYHGELTRFRKTPDGTIASKDRRAYARAEVAHLKKLKLRFDEHLRAVFAHLVNGRRKMVVLIFDNVDQRTPELQRATFIQAQIAASKWDVFVMLALRPDTFVRAKLEGEIAGYHPRAFTIAPPRFDQLIKRRIDTAIRMLRGELPIPGIGGGATMQVDNVAGYLDVLKHSFTVTPELLGFCEDISGGNMRLALDYIIAFMSCGHVDARKILERWREQGRYTIPLHEFIRGVMFGEREYFSGKSAMIANVFDCETGDSKEAFAVLLTLSMLASAMQDARKNDDSAGYVSFADLRHRLISTGYRFEQANWVIGRCLEHRLIETNLKSGNVGEASHTRISPTGAYYLAKLARTFVYLDAVSLDTPIADPAAYERIHEVATLPARLERAQVFLEYLQSVHDEHPALNAASPWAEIYRDLISDLSRVKEQNEKAVQRRRATDPPGRR